MIRSIVFVCVLMFGGFAHAVESPLSVDVAPFMKSWFGSYDAKRGVSATLEQMGSGKQPYEHRVYRIDNFDGPDGTSHLYVLVQGSPTSQGSCAGDCPLILSAYVLGKSGSGSWAEQAGTRAASVVVGFAPRLLGASVMRLGPSRFGWAVKVAMQENGYEGVGLGVIGAQPDGTMMAWLTHITVANNAGTPECVQGACQQLDVSMKVNKSTQVRGGVWGLTVFEQGHEVLGLGAKKRVVPVSREIAYAFDPKRGGYVSTQ